MEEEVKVWRWRYDWSSRGGGAMGFRCRSPELEERSITGSSLEGDKVGVGPGVNRSRTGGCVGGCVGARGRLSTDNRRRRRERIWSSGVGDGGPESQVEVRSCMDMTFSLDA